MTARPGRTQTGTPIAGEIGDGLWLITGAGGNVLARTAPDSQLLVDSGARESGDALKAALSMLPGAAQVHTLLNTHWHPEQTGGNARFGATGAAIIAHEKTRLHLATPYYVPAEDRYRAAEPEEAWPDESFHSTGSTIFDDERIEYGHLLQAHTDGDIYVWFRNANVVAVGDALAPAGDPVLDWFGGGWLGGRADALALLLELTDARTRFVPGTGPVVGRDYLAAEHALIVELYERVQTHVRMGMSAADMLLAGVLDGLPRTFAAPEEFLYAAYKGMWAHHNTLSHDIV
jgi:glyoxylase-like metal-dependent hydrolase (beta-lactamase superfamily II)